MIKARQEFKTISIEQIYKGRVFELKRVKKSTPDHKLMHHDIIFHPGAAVIVPVLAGGELVLIKQYRPAVDNRIWEFPAGTIEKGESPLSCAKREIIEETGFCARRWRKLAEFYPAPGFSKEYMHLFLAEDLRAEFAEKDKDEYLVRRIVTLPQLTRMVEGGQIVDAKTLLGYFFYLRNQQKRQEKKKKNGSRDSKRYR